MLVLGLIILVFSFALCLTGVLIYKKSSATDIKTAGKGLAFSGAVFSTLLLFILSIYTDKIIYGILLTIAVTVIFAFKILESIKE